LSGIEGEGTRVNRNAMTSFRQVRAAAPRGRRIAVAGADDPAVLHAVAMAVSEGIVSGGRLCMSRLTRAEAELELEQAGLEPGSFEIDAVGEGRAAGDREPCFQAVAAVRDGEADILMKGFVQTADFMRAVLNKETGIRAGNLLCQVGVYEVPSLGRLVVMADVGIVIVPDLDQLVGIAAGAVQVAKALCLGDEGRPRVAMLSSVDTVNPAIPGNANAALIVQMAARGQIPGAGKAGSGAIFDGPLALDNAISLDAARHKGIVSDVAGRADVLIVPDLNSGNMLAKSVIYLCGASAAGVVTGASCPVVLTSRADAPETKLNSIALAALLGAGDGQRSAA